MDSEKSNLVKRIEESEERIKKLEQEKNLSLEDKLQRDNVDEIYARAKEHTNGDFLISKPDLLYLVTLANK